MGICKSCSSEGGAHGALFLSRHREKLQKSSALDIIEGRAVRAIVSIPNRLSKPNPSSGGIIMARLFGTDGVRGVANTELTCELAF